MLTVEHVGSDFPKQFRIVKQEVTVVEVADVDHGWLLSGGGRKKAQPWNHDRAKEKAEPLLTPP